MKGRPRTDRFFYPPWYSTVWVGIASGQPLAHSVLLSPMPARLAWIAYHRRRVPGRLARAFRAGRRRETKASRVWVSPASRHAYRGAVVAMVAPGERDGLVDLIDSIRHYEGDDIKVVVGDDLTGDFPDSLVGQGFRDVDFVRPRLPVGSALGNYRVLEPALMHTIEHYDVPVILKVDPDSLMIGAGAFDEARSRFAADQRLGLLGTTDIDGAGAPTDYRWAAWMAHPELRWFRRIRKVVNRAQANFERLDFTHGGGWFASSSALGAAISAGIMPLRQPYASVQTEDALVGPIIQAAGYSVASFGAPGEPIASNGTFLPLEPEELVERDFKIVHSVRGTRGGKSETEIRQFFKRRRSG